MPARNYLAHVIADIERSREVDLEQLASACCAVGDAIASDRRSRIRRVKYRLKRTVAARRSAVACSGAALGLVPHATELVLMLA